MNIESSMIIVDFLAEENRILITPFQKHLVIKRGQQKIWQL